MPFQDSQRQEKRSVGRECRAKASRIEFYWSGRDEVTRTTESVRRKFTRTGVNFNFVAPISLLVSLRLVPIKVLPPIPGDGS